MRFPLSIARKTDGTLYITRFAAHRDVIIFCQANEAPAGSLEYVGLHVEAPGNSFGQLCEVLGNYERERGSESLASIGTLEVAIGSSAIDVGASLFVVEACLGLSLCVEMLRNSLGLVPGCSECNDTWLEIVHRPRPVAMLAMLHHSQPDTYRNTSALAT